MRLIKLNIDIMFPIFLIVVAAMLVSGLVSWPVAVLVLLSKLQFFISLSK